MAVVAGADLERARESGRIVRKVLDELSASIEPGVTTLGIDRLGREIIEAEGARPSFLGYNGYPASVCVSINSEVVHGIPSEERTVEEGDLVSLDVGAFKNGFHADAAETVPVGDVSARARNLIEVTYRAREAGMREARAGGRVGDIGAAIQDVVESSGMSVVRQLVGHGIGRQLHEPPQVPNFGSRGRGARLSRGLMLAIEPMVNSGGYAVRTLDDGWTVVTSDGELSAHAEHTVVVTDGNPLILTG
jgi:methionyl aminopeptidase